MPRKKRPILRVTTKEYLLALLQRLEHEATKAIAASRQARRLSPNKTKEDKQIAHWQSLLSAYRMIKYRIECQCDFLEHLVEWENIDNG